MIVEDNKILLDDFISRYDWEKSGYKIVATAINGKQGITKCRLYLPEIIITDIMMPVMDGLEMLQKLSDEGLKHKAFLLSSYDEFSYAKKGFQLGVIDYLLKNEITPEVLDKKLAKAKALVLSEREKTHSELQKILEHLMCDCLDERMIGSSITFRHFLICADMPLPISSIVPERISLLSALDALRESPLLEEKIAFIETVHPYVMTAVFEPDFLLHAKDKTKEISDLAAAITGIWSQKSSCPITVFYVDKPMNMCELQRLLQAYIPKLYLNYFLSLKSWHYISELDRPVCGISSMADCRAQIICALETKNMSLCEEVLENSYRKIFDSANYEVLVTYTNELVQIINEYQAKLPDNLRDPANNNSFRFLRAEEMIPALKSSFAGIIMTASHSYSPAVSQAIHHIYGHYIDPALSAVKISAAAHVSTNYLHKIFKDETGETINNFITELRIKQSKLLLSGTNLKAYEISEKVGFVSNKYFNKLFVKSTGVTPSDYRRGVSR